ncbi:MAG: SDR family oxidoreductase [Oscillospiraceae bacterium]|nr:SDR family oxidoreductase [Oscillospiraceae bacterium]
MDRNKRFVGKIAVITGGASGLGKCSAATLAKDGAVACIFDLDTVKGPETVKEIEAAGGKAVFYKCDITREAEVKSAFEAVIAKHGKLDLLHANAGIIDVPRYIHEMTFEQWYKVLDINLNGMWLAAKYAITQMLKQDGGAIVFTGSNWAYVCDPGFTSYAASKAAVVNLGRNLALDYAKDNIRVNVVCPGNIMTPLLERQLSTEPDPEATLEAMGQISQPQEIANLVAFLLSDEASAMKGSAVTIDQGETLGYRPGLRVTRKSCEVD